MFLQRFTGTKTCCRIPPVPVVGANIHQLEVRMETRKLAAALVAFINAVHDAGAEAAEAIEKLMAEDGDGDEAAGGKGGKRGSKDKDKGSKNRSSKDKDDGDEPSEDDVVDAVRAAQKVLESADIKKLLKKHGKADRASEVEEEHRQAVIDALEKAVEDAE